MKALKIWLLINAFTISIMANGDLEFLPVNGPTQLFAGVAQSVPTKWRNAGSSIAAANVRIRLLQVSSATAAPVGEWPWKQLQVLSGQTVLERATFNFPDVKAETHFLVQWQEDTNLIFGTTKVIVYPTNMLRELKPLAGQEQAVGAFDPDNVLKPLLKAAATEFIDLEHEGISSFRGRLAIIGPFKSRGQMPDDLKQRIERLAETGTGIVWFQPPGQPNKIQPSFRTVIVSAGVVIVAQPELIPDLTINPQSQLNLIRCCQLACEPEPAMLPNSNPLTP